MSPHFSLQGNRPELMRVVSRHHPPMVSKRDFDNLSKQEPPRFAPKRGTALSLLVFLPSPRCSKSTRSDGNVRPCSMMRRGVANARPRKRDEIKSSTRTISRCSPRHARPLYPEQAGWALWMIATSRTFLNAHAVRCASCPTWTACPSPRSKCLRFQPRWRRRMTRPRQRQT